MFLSLFFLILAIALVVFLLVCASGFVLSAAPLCLAFTLGFLSQKINHWLLFAILVIVLYSLSSYLKLRKAITFASISVMGGFIVEIITMFAKNKMPESQIAFGFVRLVLQSICAVLALYIDSRKDAPFSINIASHVKLPILVQRIVASLIYGFSAAMMFALSFRGIFENPVYEYVIEWILLFVGGILTFILDIYMDRRAVPAEQA